MSEFHNFDPWDLLLQIRDNLDHTHDKTLTAIKELELQKDQLATLYLIVDQMRNQLRVINTKKGINQ